MNVQGIEVQELEFDEEIVLEGEPSPNRMSEGLRRALTARYGDEGAKLCLLRDEVEAAQDSVRRAHHLVHTTARPPQWALDLVGPRPGWKHWPRH